MVQPARRFVTAMSCHLTTSWDLLCPTPLRRIPSIPVYLRWVTWINMLRYAWSGLMLNQFQYNMDAELGACM